MDGEDEGGGGVDGGGGSERRGDRDGWKHAWEVLEKEVNEVGFGCLSFLFWIELKEGGRHLVGRVENQEKYKERKKKKEKKREKERKKKKP